MLKINLLHLARKCKEEGLLPEQLKRFFEDAGYSVNEVLPLLEKERCECEDMIHQLTTISKDVDEYMYEKISITRGEFAATSHACTTLIDDLLQFDTRPRLMMRLSKADIRQMYKNVVTLKKSGKILVTLKKSGKIFVEDLDAILAEN